MGILSIVLLSYSCKSLKKDTKTSKQQTNYQDSKKYGYRLGDMFRSKKFRDDGSGKDYHLKNFPQSIASEYMRRTDDDSNYAVLMEICSDYMKKQNYLRPSPQTLVIHLRIGDVIDNTDDTVEQFLKEKDITRMEPTMLSP